MLSIRKAVDNLTRLEELEKREELATALHDCYALAINSSAQYALEVDPALTAEFRGHLKTIEEQGRAAASAEQLRAVQSSFRGELREYRDKSSAQLAKMRKEVEDATAAMMVFAGTVASNGENHGEEVRSLLHDLESSAQGDSIEEMRNSIGSAVVGIRSSVEQIRRNNQMVVAQLQDEIRVLHLQTELERKALFTDRASGAWNRQKIDMHLDNRLRQNQPFCLLLVWVRNLKTIEAQNSRTVIEGALKALIGRFAAIAGDEAVIGRWTEDQFVAVLDLPPEHVLPLSVKATRKLSGNYSVQENGLSQSVTLEVTAGVIDRGPDADSAGFHHMLRQLAGAISSA